MKDEQIDQDRAYAGYFEAVKNFNRANDEYKDNLARIADNRRLAIQRAIEIQVNPVLSRARAVQILGGFMIVLSIVFLLISLDLTVPPGPNSQGFEAIVQIGLGTLRIVGSLGTGILSLIAVLWASIKISRLNALVLRAQSETDMPSAE